MHSSGPILKPPAQTPHWILPPPLANAPKPSLAVPARKTLLKPKGDSLCYSTEPSEDRSPESLLVNPARPARAEKCHWRNLVLISASQNLPTSLAHSRLLVRCPELCEKAPRKKAGIITSGKPHLPPAWKKKLGLAKTSCLIPPSERGSVVLICWTLDCQPRMQGMIERKA